MNCTICGNILIGKQTKFCSAKCKATTTNNKHQNYLAQQQRALARKIRFINILGGQCSSCGYCQNIGALCFHHKTPKQKSFQLDLRNLSNRCEKDLLNELKKCVLLCHNCHLELHHPNLNLLSGDSDSNREP